MPPQPDAAVADAYVPPQPDASTATWTAPDFTLTDVNPQSSTNGQSLTLSDNLGKVVVVSGSATSIDSTDRAAYFRSMIESRCQVRWGRTRRQPRWRRLEAAFLLATTLLVQTLVSRPAAAATVEEVVDAMGCSTGSVAGLAEQIVDEVNCLVPNAFSQMPSRPNLSMGGAVFPYLQTAGRDALVQALDDHSGTSLHVTSMLRTVAQQYLLYRWYQLGACGIPLAATPGNSNHEQGTAFDTGDYSAWSGTLGAYGWSWFGSSDVYHFDYTGGGANNLSGMDVLAFQRLWNRNHPGDLIDEDSIYGPQTGGRLSQSPADGFAQGTLACCGDPPPQGECDGSVARWCDGSEVQTRDCAAESLVCAFDDSAQSYGCLDPCPGVDAAGRCDGDTLVTCEETGTVNRDCAAEGLVCAMNADTSEYDCLEDPTGADAGVGPDLDAAVSPDATPDSHHSGGAHGGCGCAHAGGAKGSAGLLLVGLLLLVFVGRTRARWRARNTLTSRESACKQESGNP